MEVLHQFAECLHLLHQDLEMKIITNFTEGQRNIMKNGQNMNLEQEQIDHQVQDHHGCQVHHLLHHQDVIKKIMKSIIITEGPDDQSKILFIIIHNFFFFKFVLYYLTFFVF